MNIDKLLSSWQEWAPCKPKLLERLGGHSNQSFLVQCNQTKFVVRINLDRQVLGVDRVREISILDQIQNMDFSPNVVTKSTHFQITEFIEASNDQNLPPEKMARLFKRIHGLTCLEEKVLDPFETIKNYLEQITDSNIALENIALQNINQKLQKLKFARHHYCLCHNDLLPENIIQTKHGTKIIDWEYAQQGNPLFDIAVHIEHLKYSDAETQVFLTTYNGSIGHQSITQWRLVAAFVNLLWWRIKKPQQDILPGLFDLETRIESLI